MKTLEQWIWLNKEQYPDDQTTQYAGRNRLEGLSYAVAEFKKTLSYNKKIAKMKIRFSGDADYRLYINGEIAATGPISAGGDFLNDEIPRFPHYASTLELEPGSNEVDFFAQVKLQPVKIIEYSKGHGGFMLTAWITFEDGYETIAMTDETWLVRKNGAYIGPHPYSQNAYDSRIEPTEYSAAEIIPNIWSCEDAPIPVREEGIISPEGFPLKIAAGEKKEIMVELDKIYAGFIELEVKTSGLLNAAVKSFELSNKIYENEYYVFDRDSVYRGFQMHSLGGVFLEAENNSDSDAYITLRFITTNYPVYTEAKTSTSDSELNNVLRVAAHTLKYCRQMIHLDSPAHGEPLACTGDYYIESLMTLFSFGDLRLAELDVKRTAELIRYNGGRMFHTTYSLIWVQMLYDMYVHTGHKDLFEDCRDALIILLDLFETYVGENGLIENPPDYMFIDWIKFDGFDMHHPPKALGQSCLNMFYYGALNTASKIFAVLGNDVMSKRYKSEAASLKKNINELLFDPKENLYFEGLNTPTPAHLIGKWMPENTDKRYYRRHANILAAYFGVCDKEKAVEILDRVMSDDSLGLYQPYFAHFLLEAIYRNGLADKYTLEVCEQWKAPVRECSKGLAEGFHTAVSFDHSHAWGGTPLYSIPKALTGIEVLEPGYKKISLNPSLLGLEFATVEIPTEFGMITVELKRGCAAKCKIPEEIELVSTNIEVEYIKSNIL
ncbi:MAG: hypothetical protein E7672_02460 [Ruminococcaceae bacterium]|nr:hypothetical protein [Oscillospiraceae bacterium]